MVKILFVCHGNICRSPTAEFIMKDMVKKAGLEDRFHIASAATSTEELGNGVYPPAKRMLAAHGISCEGKRARQINASDYEKYDYIIGMDSYNMRNMLRVFKNDPDGKLHNLLDFAGRKGEAVADPWYTGDFQRAWDDIEAGCAGLLKELCEKKDAPVVLDFSRCHSRRQLYEVLRRTMDWQDWYGENLDALWDILTGLPHAGKRFSIIQPENADDSLIEYAALMESVFREAGALAE